MIRIQALARKGFIWQRRNLVRELRHVLEGIFKPVLVEPGCSGRNMHRLLKQARGMDLEPGVDAGSSEARVSAKSDRRITCTHKNFPNRSHSSA